MRNYFIDLLTKEAKSNNKIMLMVGDLGFSVVENFKEKFPTIMILNALGLLKIRLKKSTAACESKEAISSIVSGCKSFTSP